MTHVTGPRQQKVLALARRIWTADGARIRAIIAESGCTISEAQRALHEANMMAQEALHDATMSLLTGALRPLEPFTCPTCPHPEDLTPELIAKIGAAVRTILNRGRRPQ